MKNGIVKFYNPESRYGFIEMNETGEVIYFKGEDMLYFVQDGDPVSFETSELEHGKQAVKIQKPTPKIEE